jgi:hypothetical protein
MSLSGVSDKCFSDFWEHRRNGPKPRPRDTLKERKRGHPASTESLSFTDWETISSAPSRQLQTLGQAGCNLVK